MSRPAKRATSTSAFGVSRRESHDASEFYARFAPPAITDDDHVEPFPDLDTPFILGDARAMDAIPDNSVALVVTSPPYFVGKEYEADVQRGEIPSTYQDYLTLLRDVFAECARVLEPGGRIAVNVANLGRKPYRSLAADVIDILQGLGLLLRGEVVWQKQEGSSGSCAWGTFRKPTNPVLRDTTERVVIASKGRFDRAIPPDQRARHDPPLPHVATISSDEFMEATLDVWRIPSESARRVGHPAPFPVALPERLIRLFTWEGDAVLDPFMGSGSTLVAAASLGRRYVGYDLDPRYVELAAERVRTEAFGPDPDGAADSSGAARRAPDDELDLQARAAAEGKAVLALAEQVLTEAGFTITGRDVRPRGLGVTINVVADDRAGNPWNFDVTGAFTTTRSGLVRTDTAHRSLGRASVLAANGYGSSGSHGPVVLLTSHLPRRNTDADRALRAIRPTAATETFFDAIAMLSDDGAARLRAYATGEHRAPLPGFWSEKDLS